MAFDLHGVHACAQETTALSLAARFAHVAAELGILWEGEGNSASAGKSAATDFGEGEEGGEASFFFCVGVRLERGEGVREGGFFGPEDKRPRRTRPKPEPRNVGGPNGGKWEGRRVVGRREEQHFAFFFCFHSPGHHFAL